jgi:hypothetical protein
MYEPIKFRYLIPKPGRIPSDVLLSNFNQKNLEGKIVTWDGKSYNYMVFNTAEHLYKYIMQLPESDRTLHEVIFGNKKHRIHFDIDKATQDEFDRIRAAIRHVWKYSSLLPPYENRKNIKVITMNSGGDPMNLNLISCHIVINYYVPNYEVMKLIAGEVVDILKMQKNNDELHLDMIYGTIHNFRILYCRKYKDGSYGPPKLPITRGFKFEDSLIQVNSN